MPILGTEAQKGKAKAKQGKKKKVALPRCAKNVTCDWSESKINYRIEKAKTGKRRLYHVETRTLDYNSGSVRFSLTPAYRKYFTRTRFTNPEAVRLILGGRILQDSRAPIVIDGKVSKRATFDDVHGDPVTGYRTYFSQHQEFNGEYTCSSAGSDADVIKTICRISVYLTDYKVPYYSVAKNPEKNCRCFARGMYEMKNYAQVEFKVEKPRRTLEWIRKNRKD